MSALIRVLVSKQSLQVRPGERADLTVTVQNFSEVVDRYRIVVEGVEPSWVTISRPELALFPRDRDQVRITIHPPAGPAARADRYTVQIQVISEENPAESTTISLDLEVAALPSLELTLRPQRQSGVTAGEYQVVLANRGNTDMALQLQAHDPEEGCRYRFDPPHLLLPPGQERSVPLTVTPASPLTGQAAKTYAFTVTARSAETDQLLEQTQGEWVQTPPSFDLLLRPQRQSSLISATFRLQISNSGPSDLTLQLEASDPEELCRFTFDPPRVTVSSGQEKPVQLTVSSTAPLAGQAARTYAFTVTARPDELPSLTRQVQGEWEQAPPSFELALLPQKGRGMAQGAFAVHLRNLSSSDLSFQLEASDPDAQCSYSFDAPRAVVPAGQERQVRMTVLPRSPLPGLTPRACPFIVTARPIEVPGLTRQAQGEWEQVPPSFELALTPQQQRGSEGPFTVRVRNLGDANLTVQLQAADPAGECTAAFNPPQMVVPAGQEQLAHLTLRSRTALPPGVESKSFSFTVTARPAEAPAAAQQVQGTWEQIPRLRLGGNLWAAALLTLIGWVVAWGLFGLYGPQDIEGWSLIELAKDGLAQMGADGRVVAAVPWLFRGLLHGAIGGLFTGIALRVAERRVAIGRIVGLTLVWALARGIAEASAPITEIPFEEYWAPIYWAVVGGLFGLVGGWFTGGGLHKAGLRVSPVLIALGWALAWAGGEFVAETLLQQGFSWPVMGWVMGAIGGLVGSAVTFWQVNRARRGS